MAGLKKTKYARFNRQIKRWVRQGCTFAQVLDNIAELDPDFGGSESGIRTYCRSRGYYSCCTRNYDEAHYKLNLCDSCKYCKVYTATDGIHKVRVCTKQDRVITRGVKTTSWCPLPRQEQNDKNNN